jgi:hypothetical protein
MIVVLALAYGVIQVPSIAAGALLHPYRSSLSVDRPPGCVEREFEGEGLTLRGWFCAAESTRRGSVIYLHGVADNRSSAVGVVARLTARGFDVIAYDSRAHGASDGAICTYGFYEKADVHRVIEALEPGPVILIGNSLGAAVALQGAVGHERVAGVVAIEPFSDLRTIVAERAPRVLPSWMIRRAFLVAEERGRFDVDSVSPMNAARSLRIPVLLIHGSEDHDTPPAHSRRVLSALAGPKRLILVPGAHHNESVGSPGVWSEVERWLETVSGQSPKARRPKPRASLYDTMITLCPKSPRISSASCRCSRRS